MIGETCCTSARQTLSGVTLGAPQFAKDETTGMLGRVPGHPDVGDNVVIYAGATILGGDTVIGHDAVIGNVWLIHLVPPGSKVYNRTPKPIVDPAIRVKTTTTSNGQSPQPNFLT